AISAQVHDDAAHAVALQVGDSLLHRLDDGWLREAAELDVAKVAGEPPRADEWNRDLRSHEGHVLNLAADRALDPERDGSALGAPDQIHDFVQLQVGRGATVNGDDGVAGREPSSLGWRTPEHLHNGRQRPAHAGADTCVPLFFAARPAD